MAYPDGQIKSNNKSALLKIYHVYEPFSLMIGGLIYFREGDQGREYGTEYIRRQT